MITRLRGVVTTVGAHAVELLVGPVGLAVHLTPAGAARCRTGHEVELFTSMIVREDAWTMYGFTTAHDKHTFDTVQKVSGIGPKLALALVSVLSADELASAVHTKDVTTLTRVPGVGKKSAERLILELRDRLPESGSAPSEIAGQPGGELPLVEGWAPQVTEALVELGWNCAQAQKAVAAAKETMPPEAPVPEALRSCLQWLGR